MRTVPHVGQRKGLEVDGDGGAVEGLAVKTYGHHALSGAPSEVTIRVTVRGTVRVRDGQRNGCSDSQFPVSV